MTGAGPRGVAGLIEDLDDCD